VYRRSVASLQARHSRACPLYPWTPFRKATKQDGCTCAPLYHVVTRHTGKLIREPVGHNRKEAERALDARRGDVARRRYRVVETIRFDAWADNWIESLRTAGRKESTVRGYEVTLEYAKVAFRSMNVRDIRASDISAMLDGIAKKPRTLKKVSQSTLAKHLRQLGSCLGAAVSEGYAEDNPVSRLHSTRRPKISHSAPAYFTNEELSRLWPEVEDQPLYSHLCRIAVATGMRSGELVALRWSDVSMTTSELIVGRTYDARAGETATKSGKTRTVDLSPQAAQLFTEWYALAGGSDGLVFQRETGGHLDSNHVIRQVLYPAMERAGIPRVGEHGRKRTFHSFRHSFARITLEAGAEITWVQQQLGHQSIQLTVSTYGRWSRAAQRKQAERLAGAFPI
jgi:integrase